MATPRHSLGTLGMRCILLKKMRKQLGSPYWATVIVALFEVTPPDVAVTVEVPTVAAVANPVDEMLATELGTDVHVEMVVTSAVEPSL